MSLSSASRHLQYEKIYSVQGCYVYGFHDRMVNTVCVHLHEVLIEKKKEFLFISKNVDLSWWVSCRNMVSGVIFLHIIASCDAHD